MEMLKGWFKSVRYAFEVHHLPRHSLPSTSFDHLLDGQVKAVVMNNHHAHSPHHGSGGSSFPLHLEREA